MRGALRVLAVALLLVAVSVLAAGLLLPGVADRPAVRERIQDAAEEALGRDVTYRALRFGFFPPSLLVEKVVVAGASADAPPLVETERVALRVAMLPLIAGTVLVDSLQVKGARIHLVRSEDGIGIPRPGADVKEPDVDGSSDGNGGVVGLAVAALDLTDSQIVIDDRSVSPPVEWELRDVTAKIRWTSRGAPVDLSFGFDLASGGRIEGQGSVTLAGFVDIELTLDSVVVAPARAYVGSESQLAGKLDGTIVARGPVENLESLRIDAELAEGRIQIDDMTLAGRVAVVADLHGSAAALRGSFEFDATDAEVSYAEMFTKPPGDAAMVKGKLIDGPDGSTRVDDVQLKIKNFKGTASVQGGRRPRVSLTAPPFELAGWEALFPALAGTRLAGLSRFDALEYRPDPPEVRGRVDLDGVTVAPSDGGPVRVDGALVGSGGVIVSENLTLVAAGQAIGLDVSLRDLGGDQRFRVRLSAKAVDTNRLVSTYTSKKDFVYGALTSNADLRGSLAGKRAPVETLAGSATIDIGNGRLVGVSLLQLTFAGFQGLTGVAQLVSQLLGGPDLEPFYGDAFDEIHGNFEVVGGVVRSDDLRIVYPDYRVDLNGTLRLNDLGIDMQGRIVLGERIAATLGRGNLSRESNEIRLARVTGTLDDPKVHVSPDVVVAFLGRSGGERKAREAIEDAIGGELGGQVGDLLEGLLGGSRRR